MNRRIFANLILYDIRKGFRENKIKWIVGVFIFVFFSFITVSDFSVNSPELGFLAYFTNILQGMPPYIKTDDSVFTIPVSWFLFYAFLFFMVGFYPLSDLYGAGKKTLILSGSRFKWLWSKYIWTVINVIMYYAALILVLAAVTCAIGKWSTKPDDMLMEIGIDMQQFATGNEVLVWLILPMLCALYYCGGAAYYQYFCRCDRWIYCFHSLSCGICLLGESVSYGQLSYDHQKQQNLCGRNGCGCRNNKLHYCDGGFCCARKCVF